MFIARRTGLAGGLAAGLASGALLLSGCGGSARASGGLLGAPARSVSPADFNPTGTTGLTGTGLSMTPPTGQESADTVAPPATSTPLGQSGLAASGERALLITPTDQTRGPSVASDTAPPPATGPGALIDAKVGEVNGRAVLASEVFDRGTLTQESIGARLAAEARRLPPARWRAFATEQITAWLDAFITDELLRAEALASLTPEERQGFLAFIERAQRDLQRQRGGSRLTAERSLLETEGLTLDQWRRRQEDIELIKLQLTDRVFRRVNVAFRDIEQRYNQQPERFNPPPKAVFRLVQVFADRPADVEAFAGLLASGVPFEEAAKSPLNFNKRDAGGLEEREVRGTFAEGQFFANEQINAAARGLSPGQIAGPITTSAAVSWLKLERIEDRSRSLYDAQLQVEDEVRRARREREQNRYLSNLRSNASMTDMRLMVDELLAIATTRYLPAAAALERETPRAGSRMELSPGAVPSTAPNEAPPARGP